MEPYNDEICCPYCAVLIPAKSTICINCGHELHSGLYAIVPDGSHFAISFGAEIKIHGLTRESAERILDALNKYLA